MDEVYKGKETKLPFPPPPYWNLLGIEVLDIDDGYARLVMPFHEKLTQPYGIVHGGAIFSLADSAVAVAVLSMVEPERKVVTVEMNISFLTPVKDGVMEARARVLKKGRIIPAEVDIANKGILVAKAISTYIILSGDKKL